MMKLKTFADKPGKMKIIITLTMTDPKKIESTHCTCNESRLMYTECISETNPFRNQIRIYLHRSILYIKNLTS